MMWRWGVTVGAFVLCLADWSAAQTSNIFHGSMSSRFRIGGSSRGHGGTSFTYGGEGSGDCSGDICRGGTCTGTTPNGTCTLTIDSAYLHTPNDSGTTSCSVVLDALDFTLTAGTLTIGTPCVQGSALIIRVARTFTMSGGTIDMKGKGAAGATGGACASSNAGKVGGNTMWAGGAAGTTSGTAGTAGSGVNVTFTSLATFPFWEPLWIVGAGGGACPSSGQTAAADFNFWGPSAGGSGGGGGGCAASCSGTCGAGGRGGGMVWIEVAGEIPNGTGGTIDVRGNDGATGGGSGGGGGGVLVSAWENGSAGGSPTVLVSGGAAGASPPTNCGAGSAGGGGVGIFTELAGRGMGEE